ncbi:MAG: VWA domain-containing protein [Anaerolineae bacterium]|nr:VWA domain-containing protein [Anaerolineae bacterium]
MTLLLFANVFVLTLLATDRTNPVAWIAGGVVGLVTAALGYLQVLPLLEQRKVRVANPILAAVLMLGLGIELLLLWQTSPAPKPTVAMMFVVDTSGAMTQKVYTDVTRFDIALAALENLTGRSSLNQPQNWRGLRISQGGDCGNSNSRMLLSGTGISSQNFVNALLPYKALLRGFTVYRPSLAEAVAEISEISADIRMVIMLLGSLDQGPCGTVQSLADELKEIYGLYGIQTLVCAFSIGANPSEIAELDTQLRGIANACYDDVLDPRQVLRRIDFEMAEMTEPLFPVFSASLLMNVTPDTPVPSPVATSTTDIGEANSSNTSEILVFRTASSLTIFVPKNSILLESLQFEVDKPDGGKVAFPLSEYLSDEVLQISQSGWVEAGSCIQIAQVEREETNLTDDYGWPEICTRNRYRYPLIMINGVPIPGNDVFWYDPTNRRVKPITIGTTECPGVSEDEIADDYCVVYWPYVLD